MILIIIITIIITISQYMYIELINTNHQIIAHLQIDQHARRRDINHPDHRRHHITKLLQVVDKKIIIIFYNYE
jgi:hypothetical protein